jgi:DNA-binding NarL/FixJ family response regulator
MTARPYDGAFGAYWIIMPIGTFVTRPSNGKEAVERFQQAKPDLIVIDFQMPEMNGLDAARRIVDLSPKTPILMVTIHLSKQLSEEARKVGIRGTCAKGDIGCVVDAVGALLRQETYFPN